MRKTVFVFALLWFAGAPLAIRAQEMPEMWSKTISADPRSGKPDTTWFEDAKFGLFIHWGLYSSLGNEWQKKNYYGSGEWIMNRAKIRATDYAKLAEKFNPTEFNADDWARFAHDAGVRYLVITAKHHEGFAMFGSKASSFNIVDATPYGKDPMAALAEACRREGVKFGFYYSQFLDWHEPNGGGNTWDFNKDLKDVKKYYAEKSIPQLKELVSNYGPLGLVWFDMPGGLSRDETVSLMSEVRRLQPQCLISSRVGQGLGDFRDFGDSELPPTFINGPWEAIFTHNDSWGFVKSDLNFKTPRELIQLLASTSARGGNLMVNVGPDGTGRIPETSLRYLREVGAWLRSNGESIYGTRHSPIPDQPWGVSTLKAQTLYLHVFQRPKNGRLIVPSFAAKAQRVTLLNRAAAVLPFRQDDGLLEVELPAELPDARDSVVAVEFSGTLTDAWANAAVVVSRQFEQITLEAANARVEGASQLKSVTHSRYFGNWKHDTCVIGQAVPADRVDFSLNVIEAGDYHVTLEYACATESKGREGVVEIGDQTVRFETLLTGSFDSHQPLMLVRHALGVVSLTRGEAVPVVVHPLNAGAELFWLRRMILEPVR